MIKEHLEGIIQELSTNPVVNSFNVIKEEVGEDEGYIRIKCHLSNRDILEFAEYFEVHKGKVSVDTYSYHWQDTKGHLTKRWDNVSHHKELATFPHHLHLSTGEAINTIPMSLKRVLSEIEKSLPAKQEE